MKVKVRKWPELYGFQLDLEELGVAAPKSNLIIKNIRAHSNLSLLIKGHKKFNGQFKNV